MPSSLWMKAVESFSACAIVAGTHWLCITMIESSIININMLHSLQWRIHFWSRMGKIYNVLPPTYPSQLQATHIQPRNTRPRTLSDLQSLSGTSHTTP